MLLLDSTKAVNSVTKFAPKLPLPLIRQGLLFLHCVLTPPPSPSTNSHLWGYFVSKDMQETTSSQGQDCKIATSGAANLEQSTRGSKVHVVPSQSLVSASNTAYNSPLPYVTKDPTILNEHNHSVLFKQLIKHSAKWRVIGSLLGFLPSELHNIEAKPSLNSSAPISWLSTMLSQWLQWAPEDSRGSTSFATLEDLKAALSQAELGAAAHDLGI